MLRFCALAAALSAAVPAVAKDIVVAAGPNAQERLQSALLDAKPGDVVRIGAGRFELTDGLSLDVNGVTIRGAGADRTVLSFKGQLGAGEGLLVTSDDVVLRDFAVEDSKGDGFIIKFDPPKFPEMATGADVIGLDWRQPLDLGWREVGHTHAVQGNLDPITLFAPIEVLELRVKEILQAANGRPGHIFNLGHGIVPNTPVENVQAVARMVREFRLESSHA